MDTIRTQRCIGPGLCVLLIMFLFPACSALFWRDTVNWQGGSWQGADRFVEIQLEYETKASWNPLNQNALSRDYHTRLLQHRFEGDRMQTAEIARYPGWTLNGSLFLAGDWLIAQRGLSDGYGTEDRELIAVALRTGDAGDAAQNEPRLLLKPESYLMAAFPAPDGRRLAVFLTEATMQKPTGEFSVAFFDFADGAAEPVGPRVTVSWHGAPGLPNLAWDRDSSRIYIQRNDAVLQLAPGQAAPTPAASFPQCFRQTRTGHNISEAGKFFFRTPEGEIALREEAWLPYDQIQTITRIDKIGAGCP